MEQFIVIDSNGTIHYYPVVYMQNCENLSKTDLKLSKYLLFNLTKGFKGLDVLSPGTKFEINCRHYIKGNRNAGYSYPTNIVIANNRPDFPDDPNVLTGMIMVKNQDNPEAENDPVNTELIKNYNG